MGRKFGIQRSLPQVYFFAARFSQFAIEQMWYCQVSDHPNNRQVLEYYYLLYYTPEMPSRSTTIPAIKRPGEYYLRGISKYIQHTDSSISPAGLGILTTVQLVQLYQLVCGAVWWCGGVVYHCVQNTFSPRGLQKKSSLCYQAGQLPRISFHDQTLLSGLDQTGGRTETE